ncbi:MAG: diacylglycerol kinase [Sulfurospirillum sp.]
MKPKYNIRKNFLYATDGAKELLKESSFRIEIAAFALATIVLLFLPYPIWAKLFMFASLFIPLLTEALNTAIEKIVDMTVPEYHILAKHAKDIAAFGVLMSIFISIFIWLGFIVYFK